MQGSLSPPPVSAVGSFAREEDRAIKDYCHQALRMSGLFHGSEHYKTDNSSRGAEVRTNHYIGKCP